MRKIKKKDLITIIQNTRCFNQPKVELEQYCIDAVSAVDIIFFAGVEFNDITDKVIFDLGAGTGRLSLACAFLNPIKIISVDIDKTALKILRQNFDTVKFNFPIYPICCDLEHFPIVLNSLDLSIGITTIMNPPFGVQNRKADRIFLERAFSFSDVVYSLHLSGEKNRVFIKRFVQKLGWKIDYFFSYLLLLEKTFHFHKKKTKKINIDVYRFLKNY